jgi:hypothetical protein
MGIHKFPKSLPATQNIRRQDVTWKQVPHEDPQILGPTVQNSFSHVTWLPGFFHLCFWPNTYRWQGVRRIILNEYLGRLREGTLFICLQQCHSNCLEWLRKTTQYLVKYISSPYRNSKQIPPTKLAIYYVCHYQYRSMLFRSTNRSYCFECQPYMPHHWRYSHAVCECGPPCQTSSISCDHVYLSISEDVQISEPFPGNTVAAAPHSDRIRLP